MAQNTYCRNKLTHTCMNVIFDKSAESISGRSASFQQMVVGQLNI